MRRKEITALATQAVQKDGLHSVSFRNLANEIGIKSSSVHYHFPTKPDLAEALITEYTENFARQLKEIERTHDTLDGQLGALVEVFESVIKDQNLCLCGMMAAELTALDKSTQQALGKFFVLMENWVASAFNRHQPVLKIQLSHEQLAQILVSGLEGAMLLDRTEDGGKRLAAFHALVHALTD